MRKGCQAVTEVAILFVSWTSLFAVSLTYCLLRVKLKINKCIKYKPSERIRSWSRTTAQWTMSLSPEARQTGSLATSEEQCNTLVLNDWFPTHRKLSTRKINLCKIASLEHNTLWSDLIIFGVAQISALWRSWMANWCNNPAAQYTRSLSSV